jgi:hypothetical protein
LIGTKSLFTANKAIDEICRYALYLIHYISFFKTWTTWSCDGHSSCGSTLLEVAAKYLRYQVSGNFPAEGQGPDRTITSKGTMYKPAKEDNMIV